VEGPPRVKYRTLVSLNRRWGKFKGCRRDILLRRWLLWLLRKRITTSRATANRDRGKNRLFWLLGGSESFRISEAATSCKGRIEDEGAFTEEEVIMVVEDDEDDDDTIGC
jgi:hypothetical protein